MRPWFAGRLPLSMTNPQKRIMVIGVRIACATLIFLLVCHAYTQTGAAEQHPPALYVFGDSTVDAGNNNFLDTKSKADYFPYGVDFNGTRGRFTNGKTFADFIAESLKLPLPPAYLSFKADGVERSKIVTGMNYASGSSGILPETGLLAGKCLSLADQVNLFNNTVKNDLPKQLKNRTELKEHLAQSIFLISMAGNDYTISYFLNPNMSKAFTPVAYTQLLIDTLTGDIQRLYELGARKFVLLSMSNVGCSAALMAKNGGKCDESINKLMMLYNDLQLAMMNKFVEEQPGMNFTRIEAYDAMTGLIARLMKSGMAYKTEPCCTIDPMGLCIRDDPPCTDRNERLFFDAVHPSQLTHSLLADLCFNETLCRPFNIKDFANSISV